MIRRRWWTLCAGVVSLFLFIPLSLAQDSRGDARERFARGIELFDEGHFEAALAEFEQAYRIAPAYQVLYNIARTQAAAGHPVESAAAFRRYLAEGGTRIDPTRAAEVRGEIERQDSRIGFLDVVANVEGVTVSVDGVDILDGDVHRIPIVAGNHLVAARATGFDTAQVSVQVAGRVTERVNLELRPLVGARGQIRVRSSQTDVELRLDGQPAGQTPLRSTIAVTPGRHILEATRPGYTTLRLPLVVEGGSEVEARVVLEQNTDAPPEHLGELRLRMPDASYVVRVDGQNVGHTTRLELPIGSHQIDIEAADREAFRARVRVKPQQVVDFSPQLVWTPSQRTELIEGSRVKRTAGFAMLISGAVTLAASAGVMGWNEGEFANGEAATDRALARLEQDAPGMPGVRCDGNDACRAAVAADVAQLDSEQDGRRTIRIVTGVLAGVGLGLATTGIVFVVTAPDEKEVDASARAHAPGVVRIAVSPDRVRLSVSF